MNLEKQVTTHLIGPVKQYVYYDPKSKKIEVVHYFNLKPMEDVILSKIEKFVITGNEEQLPFEKFAHLKKRALKRQVDKFGTRFIYHKIKTESKDPHARKFPDRGTSYPLSNLPHHIEVIVE